LARRDRGSDVPGTSKQERPPKQDNS